MLGFEFQAGKGKVVQLLWSQDPPQILTPRHGLLPWGSKGREGAWWPLGRLVPWEALYRAAWTAWEPERLLLRPTRWLDERRSWRAVPLGHGLLAIRLKGAEGTPVYPVTLGEGRPKLVPRMPTRWEREDAHQAGFARGLEVQAREAALDRANRAKTPYDPPPRVVAPAPPFDWKHADPGDEKFQRWVHAGEHLTGLMLGASVCRQAGVRFVTFTGLNLPGGPTWTYPLPEKYGEDPYLAAGKLRDEIRRKGAPR